jgi:endonuclease III
MSATNRSALFSKIHKVLRKHYDPVAPPSERTFMEHVLYACVLENAKHEAVDDVFARLQKNYFDWNEIRVTSVPELAELMSNIPDAADAARRLKRALQSIFETHYSFDIDVLKKQGLGKAEESITKFSGTTPFVVAYVMQAALSGHSIPINNYAMSLLVVLDAVSESDAAKGRVPGLERAIPKNKGIEFGSLLQQLAVDYAATPQSTRVKSIVGEIAPDAKDRLPKKPIPRKVPPPPPKRSLPTHQRPPVESKGTAKVERPEKGDHGKKSEPKSARSSEAPEPIAKSKSSTAQITRKKPK